MIDKLLRLIGLRDSPSNDFENLVKPNQHVNLVFSNGVVTNLSNRNTTVREPKVAGQYVEVPGKAIKDGVYINLYGIMHSSDSYEEVLTRLIETEIHEMMHWGDDSTGEDRHNGEEHQIPFNNIIYDVMTHCDQAHYDFRDPFSKYEWLSR